LQAVERLTGDRPAAGTPERRTLVVQVTEAGEPVVNSRISLRLAPVAKRFLPRQAKHYLNAYDIDLEALLKEAGNFAQTRGATPSRWASVFRTLANTPGEGTLVHVEDGETVVRVAVE
jgi:hypothetical protein